MAKKIVTRMDSIVEAVERGEKIWVGVDVHTKKYAVTVLSESGVRHSFVANSDNQALIKQFTDRNLSPEVLVYEAGLTGFGLYRACRAAGIKAMIVSANRIPRPACKTAKTDGLDCLRLAELASKNMLQGIYVPSEEQEAKRALSRRRTDTARELSKAKVKMKSLLTCHGLPLPAGWTPKGLAQLAQLASGLGPGLRETLESLLRHLEHLRQEKKRLTGEMQALLLPQKKTDDPLQTVPGVGPIVSTVFRAEVIDPKRFETGEQLSGFIGLAPTISQSGESRGKSRLVPCGQGPLRGLLVESAWILYAKAPWAAAMYNRIRMRSGSAQKAVTALARKLAVILWRLWLEDRPYSSDYQSLAIEA